MQQSETEKSIIVCSDSIGETADAVARATIRQFNETQVKIHRFTHIQSEHDIQKVIEAAKTMQAFIAYTLVQPELRELLKKESIIHSVRTVDIMGPMMQAFMETFNGNPLSKPGLLHRMDEDYFRRVEAIEFTVKYDDGKDTKGVLKADIVLIGISRTSKTPLSVFLAHKGYKVANIPLIPEVKTSAELASIPSHKIFGLTWIRSKCCKFVPSA
jgi:regulator of PEP synthase PpsR (kinase-PPPase family)